MTIVYWIVGIFAVIGLIIGACVSEGDKASDKAAGALGGAAAGGAYAIGCILYLIVPAAMLLVGFWLLGKIMGW